MLDVLLLSISVAFLLGSAQAAEPFFKKDDVIALVGGEDMVAASEYGYLELLLTRALRTTTCASAISRGKGTPSTSSAAT
ncbi:MAG: hypothetical protein WDN28_23965 [Chthoniobacter sp.]